MSTFSSEQIIITPQQPQIISDVEDLKSDVSIIQSDVSGIESNISNINTEIDEVKNDLLSIGSLPDQTDNSGKFLLTDGIKTSWGGETIQQTITRSRKLIATNGFPANQDVYLSGLVNSFGFSMTFVTMMVAYPVTVSRFTVIYRGQGASGTTNGRFGLYVFDTDTRCNLLAESANDTTLLTGGSPSMVTRFFNTSRGLPSSITLQPGELYAFAILLYGNTSSPLLVASSTNTNLGTTNFDTSMTPPLIYGGTVSGVQSDLPSIFYASSGYAFQNFYARLS